MKTVSSLMVGHFLRWGIEGIFGIPGKPLVPLVLEAGNQGLRFVLCRHEAGAGFAAAGYALRKGIPGVAAGTAGPGGMHMLTAAGQAMSYHAPVLFLTGQPPLKEAGKRLSQDSTVFGTDLVAMFQPVTLFSARVERADMLKAYLTHALERAMTGRRGPVHLSVPYDVLQEETEAFDLPLPSREPGIVSSRLEQVLPLLASARKPLLLAGKGVLLSEAFAEVRELAETWGIPVVTSPGGKGAFPGDHPLSLGGCGLGGTPEAAARVEEGTDLLVVAGSGLSDMTLAGWKLQHAPERVVQFDISPVFAGKAFAVPTLVIEGDVRENLRRLNALAADRPEWQAAAAARVCAPAMAETAAADARVLTAPAEGNGDTGLKPAGSGGGVSIELEPMKPEAPLRAAAVMEVLNEMLPADAVIFGDDGSHSFHAIRHLRVREPGAFYFDDIFGCMGHAIGLAVGAQIAEPERTVVCLTGDGCAFMYGSEISTAVNAGLPVLFIVLNNGRLDMVQKGMQAHTGRSDGTIYEIPLDARLLGMAMGACAYRCESVSAFRQAIANALLKKVPTVIEAMVDPTEKPPTLARG